MSSPPTGEFEDEVWEMESDLPSLANQAAIELDNYILGYSKNFKAVKRLATLLKAGATNTGTSDTAGAHYDPITMGVVGKAIDELVSEPGQRPKNFSEMVAFAANMADQLLNVAKKPKSFSAEALAKLRDRCLVLSENASETELPPDEHDPRHRFRR
jgi:hypothetical protein